MAVQYYLPRKEADLAAFANNMESYLTGDPAGFSVTIQQAADFATLAAAFQAGLTTLDNPANRTKPNTQIKNDAKSALIDGPNSIRELVDIIQASPATTDVQRQLLEITIRDTEPTPIPVPTSAPAIDILSSIGQQVNYVLSDPADPDRRGKPDGVAGAAMFAFVGASPPLNMNEWQALASVTRTTGTLTFSSNLFPPGSQVWLTAAWFNPRNQNGPLAAAASVFLAGGLSEAA